MIKECKKEAKVVLKNNYKMLLGPALLLMIFNALSQLFLREYTFAILDSFMGSITLFLYLTIKLLVVPLVTVKLFKVSKNCINSENNPNCENQNKAIKNIINIFLINLIPTGLTAIYSIAKSINTSYMNSNTYTIILNTLNLFIFLVVNYKFFACNYLAASGGNAMGNIKASFKVMRKNFGKYFLLSFSFLHWELLAVGIYLVLLMLYGGIDNANPYFSVLLSFGCGIYFYLIPYKYLTYSIFINKLLKNHISKNTNP